MKKESVKEFLLLGGTILLVKIAGWYAVLPVLIACAYVFFKEKKTA